MKDKQLEEIERVVPNLTIKSTTQAETVLAMMQQAIQSGTPVSDLERLMNLHERMTAQQARQEYLTAFAAFKQDCPEITRKTDNPQFSVVTRNGIKRPVKYANLADIERAIKEPLCTHGISYRWSGMSIEDGMMKLTCIVSHISGHSEESEIRMPIESRAGASPQQKYAITIIYMQRYSLIQALGLVTCDEDLDGNELREQPKKITAEQATLMREMIDHTSSDEGRLREHYGIESIDEMDTVMYREAMRILRQKETTKQ